jgi:class 3 adenylate cyclase
LRGGLAHGGQNVLSGTTEPLVVDSLPADAWLTDLGMHSLRDLPRPERVTRLSIPICATSSDLDGLRKVLIRIIFRFS